MSRLIDADALIEFCAERWIPLNIDAVNMQPTIQPEPQWIPVSERLPKDMQFVLLTVRRLKAEYNHEPFISVGYIGWNQTHWWCAHDGDCEISKIEVIAWMPLPEPYKPNNK